MSYACFLSTHNIIIIYGAHAGMENQYRIPMDQYQNITILEAAVHTHNIIIYGAHAGMENQYRIPMDQYQNITILNTETPMDQCQNITLYFDIDPWVYCSVLLLF